MDPASKAFREAPLLRRSRRAGPRARLKESEHLLDQNDEVREDLGEVFPYLPGLDKYERIKHQMYTVVQEVLKMGLWHKILSQPLRYLSVLASYVSPAHRVRAASPPIRASQRSIERDLNPLDVILNEQKPFHPSKMYSHSALGYTRSFSTSAVDRARRFPERSGADNKFRPERQPVSRGRKKSPEEAGSKRRRSPAKPHTRRTTGRSSKNRKNDPCEPSPGLASFSHCSMERASVRKIIKWLHQQRLMLHGRPGLKRLTHSISDSVFHCPSASPENCISTWQLSELLEANVQTIKDRLLEDWITRRPFRGCLSELQLQPVVNMDAQDNLLGVLRMCTTNMCCSTA